MWKLVDLFTLILLHSQNCVQNNDDLERRQMLTLLTQHTHTQLDDEPEEIEAV